MEFFSRLARRKGKKRAIVVMARKLLVAIYWVLVRGEPFKGWGAGTPFILLPALTA